MITIQQVSAEFAKEAIQFSSNLKSIGEFEIASQLKRSATSVGANIREAQSASSRKDFLNKLLIASKESHETMYWIDIVSAIPKIQQSDRELILKKAKAVHYLLQRIIMTTKANMNRPEFKSRK
jgi:four helix bundle protein